MMTPEEHSNAIETQWRKEEKLSMSDLHNAERIRALEGCAILYRQAASHLNSAPPNYPEAARCIQVAYETGAEIHQFVIMDYIRSEQFQRDTMENLHKALVDYNQEDLRRLT